MSYLFLRREISGARVRSRKLVTSFLSLLFCLAGMPMLLFGKHIIGGEMTYRFLQDLGNGIKRFEFTLIVYRDCDSGGGQLDDPAAIGVYRGSYNNAVLFTDFDVPLNSSILVDPYIPPCADASAVSNACVQRGTYTFTYDIPVSATESFFFVYQRCCRTEQIVNISTPGNYGATYYVEVTPAAMAGNDNSPTFVNYPPTFICNNFPLEFNHSATDVDGDSLTYEFYNPLSGGGNGGGGNCGSTIPNPPCGPPFTPVNYIGVYTFQTPMAGMPTIEVDSMTGIMSGTPTNIGQFVVGILIREYRNGQLIGTVLRDFQFNVVDCTPSVVAKVTADAITGPKQYLVKRCGQKVITIPNISPQSIDLSTWQWEVDMPNGTIFSTNAWHLIVALPDFGTYSARLYLNRMLNCADTAFIKIIAYPGSDAKFGYAYDVCKETPVTVQDSSTSGATGGIVSRAWTFTGGNTYNNVLNFNESFAAYGDYPLKLVVTDSDGCTDTYTDTVTWQPHLAPPIPDLPLQRLCLPENITFHVLDSLNLTGSHIVWDFGDGTSAQDVLTPTHLYEEPGTYSPGVAVTTQYNCFTSDTFENKILAFPTPKADYDYKPKYISNLDNTVFFENLSDPSPLLWQWTFGAAGHSQEENPVFQFVRDTGLVPVQLVVLNQHGCSDTLTQILDIVPKIRLYIPNVFAPLSNSPYGNDKFGVQGVIPSYSNFHLTVWSRWGELLFETDNPDATWDGRTPGSSKTLPPGVYVYLVTVNGPRGEALQYQGTITLL